MNIRQDKSRQDKSDNSFAKTFIAPYTPKRCCCYGSITVVNVLKVYVRNVSLIGRYIFLLFSFMICITIYYSGQVKIFCSVTKVELISLEV